MAFWIRLRPSKLREFKGLLTLYRNQLGTNRHLYSRIFIPVSNVQSMQLDAFNTVRSYAAPVQGNQKKEERDSSDPRLNEEITAPSVRLVTAEGHFLVSRYEAIARAKSLNLDLVMVDSQATPPVCKIFDYNKEKYLQQMKEKERTKSKSALKKGSPKEIRFSGKITQKDLQIKADMVRRLMESGHRVKCTAIEPTESSDMESMLTRFSGLIDDVAHVESGPCVEKKQAYIVVRHVKFGAPKKKKGSKAVVCDELTDEDGEESSKSDSIHAVLDIDVGVKPEMANRYALPKHVMANRYAMPKPEIPSRIPSQGNLFEVSSPTRDGFPDSAWTSNRYRRNAPSDNSGNFPR